MQRRSWLWISTGVLSPAMALVAALALWVATPTPTLAWDPIAVEVGKSKLLRLKEDQEPAVVFVGNPFVADVILERSGVIFVLGREPGETDVWILDDDGNKLMHRPLVVTALAHRQVTVSRGSDGGEQTLACNPRCSQVPTPVGDNAGPISQPASVFSNPPDSKEKVSTEELIESLRELIPELAEAGNGGGAGGTGDSSR